MKKVGVIVGRFQTPKLHEGHKLLIRKVLEECDRIVIVIGKNETRMTDKNPIPYEFVAINILQTYPFLIINNKLRVSILSDHKSDEVWSQNLDTLIEPEENEEVILYGSRDSFIKYYSGKYPTKEVDGIPEISATEIRKNVKISDYRNEDFLAGMIHAANYKYPTTYPCVDVLVTSGKWMLLARKKGYTQWCFVGGFVDTTDKSLEAAAKRELSEEVPDLGVSIKDLKYVGSEKIDDWRYKGTKDGIISSLFHLDIHPLFPNLTAGDDIEEVDWFDMNEFDIENMVKEHRNLYKKFRQNA